MEVKQITIIGTGLIGGSLGLAIRKHGLAARVVGCDRQPVLKQALRVAAIDAGEEQPEKAIAGSELVMLATPVGAIIELIERVGPLLSQDVLLTDCGSTKGEILRHAKMIFGSATGQRFLPGHPMAGKEHGGIDYADADLFQGATWIFAAEKENVTKHGQRFIDLTNKVGAKPIFMGAEEHDRVCAWISQLPQMVSTAVAASLLEEFGASAQVDGIGGRALHEMTRTASSPYSMWRDIAYTNAGNIEQALLKLEQRLAHIRENLKTPELKAEFERANLFRQARKPRRRGDTEK